MEGRRGGGQADKKKNEGGKQEGVVGRHPCPAAGPREEGNKKMEKKGGRQGPQHTHPRPCFQCKETENTPPRARVLGRHHISECARVRGRCGGTCAHPMHGAPAPHRA